MHEVQLIVNADDFGLSPGVTRGIVEAMSRGVVTSASVLVNMPCWDDTVARLRDAPASAAFGLHLNLVVGRPLTRARSLVDPGTGEFLPLSRLLYRAVRGRLVADEIAAECAAQLHRLRATGVAISHADSHRHVHTLPVVARAIAPVLDGLPLRYPVERSMPAGHRLHGGVKRWLISAALDSASHAEPPLARADFFAGITLQGAPRFAERLARLVEELQPGTTELMVHPGYADAALRAVDRFTKRREEELVTLTSPELRRQLHRRGVTLVASRATRPAA